MCHRSSTTNMIQISVRPHRSSSMFLVTLVARNQLLHGKTNTQKRKCPKKQGKQVVSSPSTYKFSSNSLHHQHAVKHSLTLCMQQLVISYHMCSLLCARALGCEYENLESFTAIFFQNLCYLTIFASYCRALLILTKMYFDYVT